MYTVLAYVFIFLSALAALAAICCVKINGSEAHDDYPETQDDFAASMDRYGHITERMSQ